MFNSRKYRISPIHKLNQRIASIASQIPRDIFSHCPRLFDYVMFWSATEYRKFVLYAGHIILKDLLSMQYYNNFLMLNAALLIFLNPNSNN